MKELFMKPDSGLLSKFIIIKGITSSDETECEKIIAYGIGYDFITGVVFIRRDITKRMQRFYSIVTHFLQEETKLSDLYDQNYDEKDEIEEWLNEMEQERDKSVLH